MTRTRDWVEADERGEHAGERFEDVARELMRAVADDVDEMRRELASRWAGIETHGKQDRESGRPR